MLVLGRKTGQRVEVGPDITVTVLRVKGSYVTLGFDAPRDVPIRRPEIKDNSDDNGSQDTNG